MGKDHPVQCTALRNGTEFIVKRPDMKGILVTSGSLAKVAQDMMAIGGGHVSPAPDNWIRPERPMKLKDALKLGDGLPDVKSNMTSATLNQEVGQYRLSAGKLVYRLAGSPELHTANLIKHPFMNKQTKDMMIDRAAANVKFPQIQHQI